MMPRRIVKKEIAAWKDQEGGGGADQRCLNFRHRQREPARAHPRVRTLIRPTDLASPEPLCIHAVAADVRDG